MVMNQQTATAVNERAAEEYFRKAKEAETGGNHEKAIEFFERALNENPDHEQAKADGLASSHWTAEDAKAIEELSDEESELVANRDKAATATAARNTLLREAAEPEEILAARELLAANAAATVPEVSRADAAGKFDAAKLVMATIDTKMDANREEIKKLCEQLESLETMDCCPTCGTQGHTFHEAAAVLFKGKIQELLELQGKLDAQYREAEKELGEAKATLELWALQNRLEEAKTLLETDARIDAELAKIADALRIDIQATEQRLGQVRVQLKALRDREAAYEAREALGAIPTDAEIAAQKAAVEETEQQRTILEGAYRHLKAAHAEWMQWGANEKAIERVREEIAEAKAKVEATDNLVEDARKAKQALAATISGELLAGLTKFTIGVLPGAITANEALELIYTDERGSRGYDTLSGSEKAVIAFAVAAVFAMRSPLGIAVLDEASTMDAERRRAFLARVAEAVQAGDLAQAVVIDHREDDFAAGGWQMVKVA